MRKCVWCAMAVMLSLVPGLWAHDFAGGTGSIDDPFQIETAEQLCSVGEDPNLRGESFLLINDVNLVGRVFSESVIPLFYGRFDGQGFSIRHLTLWGGEMPLGLFGRLEAEAVIRDVYLEDAHVVGTSGAGGLAASNAGLISHCGSTGFVFSFGGGVGGIVGSNTGVVMRCISASEVSGDQNVGGGIGENAGLVLACSASGKVLGNHNTGAGGLIGSNQGRVQACHSSAEVTAGRQAGGLIGRHDGHVAASYSTGDVVTHHTGGGLVGENVASGPVAITSCYSRSSVAHKGDPQSRFFFVGGLVGDDRPSSMPSNPVFVGNCYFLASSDGGGPDNQVGLSLTGIEMTQQASFAGWDFWGDTSDGSLEDWFMPVEGTPVLPWQVIPDVVGLSLDDATDALERAGLTVGHIAFDYHRGLPAHAVITVRSRESMPASVDLVVSNGESYDWTANPGDGSALNPYQIGTAGELEALGGHPEIWQQHFVLTDDLNMSGRTYRTALIAPDENELEEGFQGTSFTGHFDGQGHVITHFEIVSIDLSRDYLGLFGSIGQEGQVHSLDLLGANLTVNPGSSIVGALVGSNAGALANLFATGTILGQRNATETDGLVGIHLGQAQDIVSEVVVISRSFRVSR
jgi:hypothetical protein